MILSSFFFHMSARNSYQFAEKICYRRPADVQFPTCSMLFWQSDAYRGNILQAGTGHQLDRPQNNRTSPGGDGKRESVGPENWITLAMSSGFRTSPCMDASMAGEQRGGWGDAGRLSRYNVSGVHGRREEGHCREHRCVCPWPLHYSALNVTINPNWEMEGSDGHSGHSGANYGNWIKDDDE